MKVLPIPLEKLQNYIREKAGKISVKKMAVELNMSEYTIAKHAYKMGVSLEVTEAVERRKMMREKIEELHDTHTAREIAAKLNIHVDTIRYTGWKMGLTFKPDPNHPTRDVRDYVPPPRFFNPYAHCNWII